MKNHLIIRVAAIIAFCATTIILKSCQTTEQQVSIVENVVYLSDNYTAFHVNKEPELEGLVKALADEASEINIIESALMDMQDSQGTFKAIVAKYHVNNELTRLVVPLIEDTSSSNPNAKNVVMYTVGDCTMKCTSAWGCNECTQEIIERCKKQKCSCSSGNGECSAETIF
jgi:hypothetical protein